MSKKDYFDTFKMDKKTLLFYFTKADEILGEAKETLSVWVSGGANMCLYVNSRESTRDIDTVPSDEVLLRELSNAMRSLFNLPTGWLNPSGTLFVTEQMVKEAVLGLDFPNLKVFFLTREAMLVLKVLAGRRDDEHHDMQDAIALIKALGVRNLSNIDKLIDGYKPEWNNPSVLLFAEDALKEAWGVDYQSSGCTEGLAKSDTLEKYIRLKQFNKGKD